MSTLTIAFTVTDSSGAVYNGTAVATSDAVTASANTIVASTNTLDPILINNSYLNGNATCNQNYAYVVGSGGTAWLFFGQNNGGPGGVGPYTGTLSALTGNINMNDGTSFNVHDG